MGSLNSGLVEKLRSLLSLTVCYWVGGTVSLILDMRAAAPAEKTGKNANSSVQGWLQVLNFFIKLPIIQPVSLFDGLKSRTNEENCK